MRDKKLIWVLAKLNSTNIFGREFKIRYTDLSKSNKETVTINVETPEKTNFIHFPCVSVRKDGMSVYISGEK